MALSGVFATCSKERINCKLTVYSFEGHYKAYPDQESLHVNDTIWLELEVPTRLLNKETNQMVDYTGAENFGTAISYIELKGGDILNSNSLPAANSFDNVLKKGVQLTPINPQYTRAFQFVEEAGSYRFKVGIVPKKKGLFAIAPGNAENVYTRSNQCDKAGFDLTFTDTEQHMYLLEQSRPGYTPSELERTHTFCFKVE